MPHRSATGLGAAWRSLALSIFVLDLFLFLADRPLHRAVFEGELGIIELPTFILLFATVPLAAWCALRSQGRARALFALVAVGCLFWGGEEVSWGQTFFHWGTPTGWASGNYQKETNFHNERGIVGTLLNQTPRFVLNALCILCVLLRLPGTKRLERFVRSWLSRRWIDPFVRCWLPAALSLAAALLAKWQGKHGYRGFGETVELYMATCLFYYATLQLRAIRAGGKGLS